MERNEIGYWMIACVVVIIAVAIITGFLSASFPSHVRNASGMTTTAFVEMAFNWLMRIVGTTTAILGIMLLLSAGLKGMSWQCLTKYAVLILIGLVVTHYSWAIVLGIVVALAVLAVGEIVKGRQAEANTTE